MLLTREFLKLRDADIILCVHMSGDILEFGSGRICEFCDRVSQQDKSNRRDDKSEDAWDSARRKKNDESLTLVAR